MKLLLAFIGVCLITSNMCSVNGQKLQLELVQVLFRHGERTPSSMEAEYLNITDPTIYGPQGFYQLTNKGKEEVYTLGRLLRQQYDEFIGEYNYDEVHALSSDHTRTKMSLQLVLAGLFPPSAEEKWHPALNWKPIPYQYNLNPLDYLLAPHQCPKYKETYRKEMARLNYYEENTADYKDFITFMKQNTKGLYTTKFIYDVGWTYYALKIHRKLNLPLPSWYSEDVYANLEDLFNICLDAMSATTKLKRINGGTLVRQFIENIDANRKAEKPKKIYLYSSHDLTLAGFTRAQDVASFKIPPFGSAIIMETYKDDQESQYVRMLSWDGSSDSFEILYIGGCEEFCPYEKYVKLVEHVIPTDEEIEFLTSD